MRCGSVGVVGDSNAMYGSDVSKERMGPGDSLLRGMVRGVNGTTGCGGNDCGSFV